MVKHVKIVILLDPPDQPIKPTLIVHLKPTLLPLGRQQNRQTIKGSINHHHIENLHGKRINGLILKIVS